MYVTKSAGAALVYLVEGELSYSTDRGALMSPQVLLVLRGVISSLRDVESQDVRLQRIVDDLKTSFAILKPLVDSGVSLRLEPRRRLVMSALTRASLVLLETQFSGSV